MDSAHGKIITYSSSRVPKLEKHLIRSIVLLPIFFAYATPVPSLTVGDLYLVITTLLYVINRKLQFQKSLLLIIIYIVILTFVRYSTLSNPNTSLRYLVYLFIISIMPSLTAYKGYALKLLERVSIIAGVLLVIQYFLLKIAGIYLPGILTFMPLMDPSMRDYGTVVSIINSGRCMSFFVEPSHFAIYMLLFIAVTLFRSENGSLKDIKLAGFATLSVILSASFTGILCSIILWGSWLLLSTKNKLLSYSTTISIIIIISLITIIFLHSSAGSYILNQETYERQSEGRFEGFEFVQEVVERMDSSIFLFGQGMIDMAEEIYLSGWPRLFMYFGIVGTVVYIISFIGCVNFNSLSMLLICLVAVLMIGTEMNFGYLLVPYMLIVSYTKNGFHHNF